MTVAAPGAPEEALRGAAAGVVALTAPVFTDLAALGEAATRRLDLGRHPVFDESRAWEVLEPDVSVMLRSRPLVTGAGMALRPPATASAGEVPSMAWWVIRDGEIRAKQHVLNPRSDSFYDVSQARWFRVPCASGAPTLLSPYVDSWGTDDVTMTAAAPLTASGEVLGVVAADLDVRRFVDAAEGLLVEAEATALLDEEDRVITATHPQLDTGTRLSATELGPVRARAAIAEFGWTVVRL
ncbi:cache domain-containing protein [Blastococcus sp. SYSU DS1024]